MPGDQEPAIPGFSVLITILIPNEGLDDSDTDFATQGLNLIPIQHLDFASGIE